MNEYSIAISEDPSYYGSECTSHDAVRIAHALYYIIRDEFPGATVRTGLDIGGRGITGPDDAVIRQIEEWIGENWTTVL